MEELSAEQVTLLATAFATEIAKNKSIKEINQIKIVLTQVVTSLGTIVVQRLSDKD